MPLQAAQAEEPNPFRQQRQSGGSSDVKARLRARFAGDAADAPRRPVRKPRKPLRRLHSVSEQKVLKCGLAKLHEQSATGTEVEELPESPPGGKKMIGGPYLRRLLSGRIELKGSPESDVCAAQFDVKHLSSEQLLRIRSDTLDLQTTSPSHNARNSFLNTVDRHLFEKLAARCFQGDAILNEVKPEALRTLGVHLALVVGVVVLIGEGWGSSSKGTQDALPALPDLWLVQLAKDDWPNDYSWGVFDANELRMQVLPGDKPDFSTPACGGKVAAVRDRTMGCGKDRMLSWEIAVFDPCTEDILAELDLLGAMNSTCRSLTNELSDALARRHSKMQCDGQGQVQDLSQDQPEDTDKPQDKVVALA